MGRSDLLLGADGEGGTEQRCIGAMGSGPMPPMVVPMRHGRRTHKVASPVTSHIHRSEGSLQEKDGPELNADFPSRWTGAAHHRGTSVVHLASLEALTTQPRCCERCQAPSTHLACEHARIEEGVTEIVEPPRSQRWLLPPQRTSQKGSPHTPTPIRG